MSAVRGTCTRRVITAANRGEAQLDVIGHVMIEEGKIDVIFQCDGK